MTDYAAIKSEVTTQTQYAAAYAARDVNAIQALYNSIAAVGSVDRTTFTGWAAKTGMRAVIQDTSTNVASPLRSSALALMDVLRGGTTGLDLSNADNVTMMNAWVTTAALTQANHDALIVLATHPRNVSITDLAYALYTASGANK